jgi:hypothetical protein
VRVASHQGRGAMPEAGRNIALRGSGHGQPTGEGMPQGVSGHAFRLSLLHRRQVHPMVKVQWVHMGGRILAGEHPHRPLPGRLAPTSEERTYIHEPQETR